MNFGDIPGVIDKVMESARGGPMDDLNTVLGADALARECAHAVLAERNVPKHRTRA